MPEKIDKNELRNILENQRKDALMLQKIRGEAAHPVELDQTLMGRLSRMDAMQQQAMAVAGLERITLELQRIEATLKRLDSDNYGYCIKCGEVIEWELLKFNPSIVMCKTCRKEDT